MGLDIKILNCDFDKVFLFMVDVCLLVFVF